MQEFASWDDFLAMLDGESGEAMRADEANFLDPSSIKVVFTDDPVVIIGPDAAAPAGAGVDGDGDGRRRDTGGGVATGDLTDEADIEALTKARPETGSPS